jgi:peptidoglycan/LPS O-acetylase OafA/YrhL
MDASVTGKPRRHYGLDWLRIAAFSLLIPIHIGDYFAPGRWVVKSAHALAWVDWPMAALRPWRLSVLFLVSGYASAALLQRLGGSGPFLKSRTARLLLPLGLGLLVLLAPQEWVRASESGYAGSFWRYLLIDRFTGPFSWPRTEHLWFLLYLWGYSVALVLALRMMPAAWRARVAALPAWLAEGRRALLAPLALMVVGRVGILFLIPQSANFFADWHAHLTFVPPLLFGFALARSPALWRAAARNWRPALAIGALGTAGLLWADLVYPGDTIPPHLPAVAILAASVAAGWAVTILLLGIAQRWLDRDHRLRRTAAEAVFPIYIVHQTIIVLVGWELRPLGLGAGAEFALLLGATLAGSFAFYLAARRVGWLRPLFGLSPRSGRPAIRKLAGSEGGLGSNFRISSVTSRR